MKLPFHAPITFKRFYQLVLIEFHGGFVLDITSSIIVLECILLWKPKIMLHFSIYPSFPV